MRRLEVSTAGFYAWASREDNPTERWRAELLGAIEAIRAEVKQRYASPRMTAELNAREYTCCENSVAKIMKAHELLARRRKRFVRTTDSYHSMPVARTSWLGLSPPSAAVSPRRARGWQPGLAAE